MANILVIDDDALIRETLSTCIKSIGHSFRGAETIQEGVKLVSENEFDLVLLDVNLPDGDGIDILPEIKKNQPTPEVIIITAEGNTTGAEMALENDVWDYILKPFSTNEIKLAIKQVLEYKSTKNALIKPPPLLFDRSAIIGNSSKITNCLNLAQQCAQSSANVLITGPTGTGKELFANTIHKNSSCQTNNFIVVDCAALPEQLVESVLFGNVKGAFTSADSAREGLVKKADGGTLFLDEIGELSLNIQKKFLRVLQERRFKPVGGTTEIESNFRLISATNRDLEQMVTENEFRSDLLFRLKTFQIELPPLNECRQDIKSLTLHYINRLCDHHNFESKGFVSEFLDILESYDWPGNVRELISTLERAILADTESKMLYPNCLPQNLRLHNIKTSIEKHATNGQSKVRKKNEKDSYSLTLPDEFLNPIKPLKQVKNYMASETEKLYLEHLMRTLDNDMEKAAQTACISKSRLYSLLKTHQNSEN
ncbi:MAG: sigma-54 dependent transcriptional regulator [Desulfobacterales bacterium]|nr:sigma-54 dependent transcriptional regulator [Desulfobacterales bacterium]